MPTFAFKLDKMTDEQAPTTTVRSLNQIFCSLRSTNPSCFQILNLGENVQFAFSPQYTTMLPKFSGDGDIYLFLIEFEEVYSMIQFSNVSQDVVSYCFISFFPKGFG